MGDTTMDPVTQFHTFDAIVRQRAIDAADLPLLGYPSTRLGLSDYELITGAQLNHFVDGAAKALMKAGLEPVDQKGIIGLLGTSDLDYAVTLLGLGRLGYTTFLISPRLPVNSIANLLKDTSILAIIHDAQFQELAAQATQALSLLLIPALTRPDYDNNEHRASPLFERKDLDGEKELLNAVVLIHSGGSTGLPIAVDVTQVRLQGLLRAAVDMVSFQTLPLYHGAGYVSFTQSIGKRQLIYLFNGNVPQTHDTLTTAIRAAKPEIVWTVPYVLKLLAERSDGIEVLKTCKIVSSAGSRCPDELGDLLVSHGIHFGTTFGATESGVLFSSLNRPHGDKEWSYLRPLPTAAPFIQMKQVDSELLECVVLDGYHGKVMSNSNDPPKSYHTSDLFTAHPSIPNAWKYVGRLDDRVTLTTGEKVLPLPMEGKIRQHPLVKEAVVFGVDRSVPGLLLFRAQTAKSILNDEYLDKVWPFIEDANMHAEGFSQIGRNMVIIVSEDIDCPTTDKSSIKRAQVYRDFAAEIDLIYEQLESGGTGTLQLSVSELESWIMRSFEGLGIHLSSPDADFFAAGVDSFKAIQMRAILLKNLDFGGNGADCSSMIIYDCGNAYKLARALYLIRTGEKDGIDEDEDQDEIKMMSSLIEKYQHLPTHVPGQRKSNGSAVVILTGATGSLGAHLLTMLVEEPKVAKVYCLVRTSPNESASDRLKTSLEDRGLSFPSVKIVPLSADLSQPDLNIPSQILTALKSETTHIIHCAWAVNFALPLSSFKPQLASVQNLLMLSLSSTMSQPSSFLFCSSVGAAIATPAPSIVPSAPVPSLLYAGKMGYAQSKLIAEKIIEKAVAQDGANATIFRIGQIIPGRAIGSKLWNTNEAIPLLVRSALTIGVLPDITTGGDLCSWLPADTLSKVIIELSDLHVPDAVNKLEIDSKFPDVVYNIVHPHPFSWRESFLPALRAAGLQFETVSYKTWLDRLAASDRDFKRNPSMKLLDYWQKEDSASGFMSGELKFETGLAEKKSETLSQACRAVDGTLINEIVQAWKKAW